MIGIITTAFGHDASITIWSKERNKFYVIDCEKITGIKHFYGIRLAESDRTAHQKILNEIEKLRLEEEPLELYLDAQIIHRWNKNSFLPKLANLLNIVSIAEVNGPSPLIWEGLGSKTPPWTEPSETHHLSHAAGGFYQSPFKKAVVVTQDCSSPESAFSVWTADKSDPQQIRLIKNWFDMSCPYYSPGRMHSAAGGYLKTIGGNTWNFNDLSGKLLGFSAYGKNDRRTEDIINIEGNISWFPKNLPHYQDVAALRNSQDRKIQKENDKSWIAKMCEHSQLSEQEEKEIAYLVQKSFVECTLSIIEQYKDLIEEYDNNIVMSGGCALNLEVNSEVIKRLGANVFVPCNPADDGLSFGYAALKVATKISANLLRDPIDMTYGGVGVTDESGFLQNYSKIISGPELVELLSSGKVVGLIQGNHELGKRSLGNRSLLADASIEGIKEKVNDIKRREYYRPFAPVCRLEDAHKWFESPDGKFEYFSTMNFMATVKESAREKYSSITHYDNTARLQTVTREQNQFLYDLLSNMESGMLLNTSLNVSGKPIMNSTEDAIELLNTSSLDCVVIIDDGQIKYYV